MKQKFQVVLKLDMQKAYVNLKEKIPQLIAQLAEASRN